MSLTAARCDQMARARDRFFFEPKAKCPNRWTKKSLAEDARVVQAKAPGIKSLDFYESTGRRLNWDVHGSGLVVRHMSEEHVPGLYEESARAVYTWALVSAESLLRLFDAFDEIAESRFDQLKLDSKLDYIRGFRESGAL